MEVTASSAIPSADALPAPCVPSDPASARSGEGGTTRSRDPRPHHRAHAAGTAASQVRRTPGKTAVGSTTLRWR